MPEAPSATYPPNAPRPSVLANPNTLTATFMHSLIGFIEKTFGPELREHAIRISKERHELRQQAVENGFQSADSLEARRQTQEEAAAGRGTQL